MTVNAKSAVSFENFNGPARPQTDEDHVAAATQILGCDPLLLQAVFKVEAPKGGFDKEGRPTILPEEHKIYRHATRAQREKLRRSGLASTTKWRRSQYKRFKRISRYDYLKKCMEIAPEAALKGTSWGLGQVMGFNYRLAGYNDVRDMVTDACISEGHQIRQAANFIVSNKLDDEFRDKDFDAIERYYNGGGQNGVYATRMRSEYVRLGGDPTPDAASPRRGALRYGSHGEDVEALQLELRALGFHIDVDGDFGPSTKRAVLAFQLEHGLEADGLVGPKTRAAITDAEPVDQKQQGLVETVKGSSIAKNAAAVGTGAAGVVGKKLSEEGPSEAERAIEALKDAGDKADAITSAVDPLLTLGDFVWDNLVLVIAIAMTVSAVFMFLRNHTDIITGKKKSS